MRTRVIVVIVLVSVFALMAGCGGGAGKPADNGASEVATGEIPGESATANAGDLEFIRGLGESRKGQTFYALVLASESKKAAAEKDATDILSDMGDVQAYVVVEPASHIKGLPNGLYHVFELYREKPTQDTIDFMDRGPAPARVFKVTVECTDPIPVVEDLEGGQ